MYFYDLEPAYTCGSGGSGASPYGYALIPWGDTNNVMALLGGGGGLQPYDNRMLLQFGQLFDDVLHVYQRRGQLL